MLAPGESSVICVEEEADLPVGMLRGIWLGDILWVDWGVTLREPDGSLGRRPETGVFDAVDLVVTCMSHAT